MTRRHEETSSNVYLSLLLPHPAFRLVGGGLIGFALWVLYVNGPFSPLLSFSRQMEMLLKDTKPLHKVI